jgi:hypothetical protein
MTSESIREAAKITLAFGGSFIFNVLVQVKAKAGAMIAHRKAKQEGSKEKFNRYTSDAMISADRCVGNFIEWQGLFLSLFWTNAVLTGKEIWLGWIYVGVRLLYPILAINGGVTKGGAQPLIFLVTVPGYVVLTRYAYLIYNAL